MVLVPPPPPSVRLEVEVDLRIAEAPSGAPQSARGVSLEPADRTWLRAIIAGAVTFVIGYAIPLLGRDLDVTASSNGSERYVPVVGAFLLSSQTSDGFLRTGYVVTGIAQLAGLAALIGGLATIPVGSSDAYVVIGPGELHLRGSF